MASIPCHEPNEHCPYCGLTQMVRNGADYVYHCGTTRLMIHEGWHNDGRSYEEKSRTIAHWRQHLCQTNRTARRDDPLVNSFRPPRPDVKPKPRAKQVEKIP